MSLLKLSRNHKIDFDPFQKSYGILQKLKNLSLIKSAYLFGSGASGKMTADSDLDLFLTFENRESLTITRNEIIHAKQDIAIDWIFKTELEFESEKKVGGVSYEAFHFGKKII